MDLKNIKFQLCFSKYLGFWTPQHPSTCSWSACVNYWPCKKGLGLLLATHNISQTRAQGCITRLRTMLVRGLKGLGLRANSFHGEGEWRLLFGTRWLVSWWKRTWFLLSFFYWPCLLPTKARRILCLDSLYRVE